PVGYNGRFWYPIRKGIGILARGLSDGLRAVATCCPLESIDLREKVAQTPFGPIRYDRVISSIPLNEFCKRTSESGLRCLASKLSSTRVLCLNLLFCEGFYEKFQGYHWIYVPDKDIPFYRLGVYSHIPNNAFRKDRTALYVERAYSCKGLRPVSLDAE